MTTTQNSTAAVTEYHWVVSADDAWGQPASAEEHEAACERAEAWLTEHEGDAISIRVRAPRHGEAAGIYVRRESGDLQILGHSIAVPDDVRALTDRAWEHTLETWT